MTEKTKEKGKRNMWLRIAIGVILGAAAGYAYYRFVGCSSGACPITSNPYISTAMGALFGGSMMSG